MKMWTGPYFVSVLVLTLAASFMAAAQTDPAPTNTPPAPPATTTAAAAATPAPAPAPTAVGATAPEATAPPPAPTNQIDHTAQTREMLQSLQRDIAAQVAVHTAAITSSLAQIEPALNRIRLQQADSAASANRTILIAAGLFSIAGFFGLGFLTLASVRAMGRFTDVAVNASRQALPPSSASAGMMTSPSPATPLASPSDSAFKPAMSGTVEHASARFQGALEQLERRIKELEHSSHPSSSSSLPGPATTTASIPPNTTAPALGNASATPATVEAKGSGNANGNANGNGNGNGMGHAEVDADADEPIAKRVHALAADTGGAYAAQAVDSASPGSHVAVQLGKGQALLNLEQVSEALECFDNALAEEPDNTDALLRKGMALEKLQDWERALECYDRAIRLDGSLTVAYLYKGGVCNRLERHREALDSYEHALRSERHRPVGT